MPSSQRTSRVTGPRATMKKTLTLHVGQWENLSLAMQRSRGTGPRTTVPGTRIVGRGPVPLISPVVQDRLILSRFTGVEGEPELQWARCLPVGEAHHSSLRAPNREGAPTDI